MPTNVITGRDITLTIASTNYDAQTTSAVLANSPTIDVYQTLDGKAYKHTDDQWTLAPAYDLLNVAIVNPDDAEELALTLDI